MNRLQKTGIAGILFVVLAVLGWLTLVPPYNVPVFEDLENNETGYLVPLDGDASIQKHFESVEFLRDRKVATKRVQIPRLWWQGGWFPSSGQYRPVVRLIKVDRTAVVREWTSDGQRGTSKLNEALTAHSQDGTGLILEFTCTAQIPEDVDPQTHGTSTFLYYYRGDSLGHVMDREVRARVQTVASEFCARFTLDKLRGHQGELIKAVREDIVPFYERRGIQITNIGLVGGFHYANPQIQAAIDKTIQDQQLRVSSQARYEAQKIDNDTVLLAAQGRANAIKAEADGKASAIKAVADANAYELGKAQQDKEFYLALRRFELERQQLNQWDGHYPTYYMSLGSGTTPLIQVPAPPTASAGGKK